MNVDWISRLPAPIRIGGYFGLQRLIGSRIGPVWREFQSWERLAKKDLDCGIEERLERLLSSVQNVEYYRKLGLKQEKQESARCFLQRFPILTREKVRGHFAELVADHLRGAISSPASVSNKRYDWLVVKTGGTTGAPTSVIHDSVLRDWGRSTRLFAQKLCGFPLGVPFFKLWGSEQDLFQQHENLDRRILRNLLGEIPMNAFRAKENELRSHYETLRRHPEVTHMMAYADSAVFLANFIEDRSLPRLKLQSVMACGGTVTKQAREKLHEIFNAEVYDKYGSRECSDLACECRQHDGLHVFSPCAYLEIVDDKGDSCPPGKQGRILVTLLNSLSFPMIRYEIGDLGIWREEEPCACGLPFPRLQSIQGRQDDTLVTEEGTRISSMIVRHFVGVSLNRQLIREWQLEQNGPKSFIFRYIPFAEEGLEANLQELRACFHKILGQGCSVQTQRVTEIPPSATGKVRWIVNSWKANSKR